MKPNLKLLTSYLPLQVDTKTIAENREKNNGHIVLKGIMQRADAVNQNGRIYPRHILEREMENYQKFIRENRALGELDHPSTSTINLREASHIVTEAHWEGDEVVGSIRLLNTPNGKIAQQLVEDGVKLGISSRGVGSTTEHGSYDMVGEDFMIICYDIVSDPSTGGAFMLKENTLHDLNANLNKSDRINRVLTDILRSKIKV
jgi:hypothetical protein